MYMHCIFLKFRLSYFAPRCRIKHVKISLHIDSCTTIDKSQFYSNFAVKSRGIMFPSFVLYCKNVRIKFHHLFYQLFGEPFAG